MPTGNTTWDDVLAPSSAPPESAATAAKPQGRQAVVGWGDVLAASPPVTLNQRPVQPPSLVLSPSERTGTNYVAAANQDTPEVRLGRMVPQSAIPALSAIKKYAVDPFNRAAAWGGRKMRDFADESLVGADVSQHPDPAPPWMPGQPKPWEQGMSDQEQAARLARAKQEHPIAAGVLRGTAEIAGSTATDPRNWPFFGSSAARPILQRIISIGFSGQLAKSSVDTARELYDKWDELTPAQRAERVTQGGISSLMATAGAVHALSPHIGGGGVRPEEAVGAERAPVAPVETAQAAVPQAAEPAIQPVTAGVVEPPARGQEFGEKLQSELLDSEGSHRPTPEGRATTWGDVLQQPDQTAAHSDSTGEAQAPTAVQGESGTWNDVLSRAPVEPPPTVAVASKAKPPRAKISTARSAVALRNQQATQGAYGMESAVKTPTSDIPAKYKLVEASDLQPSHNAETFAPNPKYPPGVQERAYHTSKEAQARVIQQEQNYDPRYTVNTNPDAVNGPPIVTPDGTVLGGNSRTMSTQRLYARGQGEAYRNYLSEKAGQFGISPDVIKSMRSPVLVREIAAPADIEAARRLGSELNKNMTGALGVSERAVSAGKAITPQSLTAFSGMLDDLGPDSSIRDLLRERGRDVISLLIKDGAITERERPQFVDTATGGLSEEGKQFAERALLGTVVDDPTLMDRTPKSVLNKLGGSLADLAQIAPRTDEYNLVPLVREALAEHADIASRGLDVETHLAQAGMFGPERNPAVDAIVRKLAEKPKNVRDALRGFVHDANAAQQGQGFLAMMEPPTAAEAFNAAFGTDLSQADYEQSVIQSLEREATKGSAYAASQPGTQGEAFPPNESLRSEPTTSAPGSLAAGTEPTATETDQSLLPPDHGAVGGGTTLSAHTPFSIAKLSLDRINKFYDERIAERLIQNRLQTGRTHPEVERADPELADDLRLLDNAPKYFRQKAQAIIRNVTAGLSRDQERLLTLMADADSRENLRTKHADEYRQAERDPAIQAALKKYRPEERKLTDARKAMGGQVIDDDYLRRVYDKHIAGINKRDSGGKTMTAYDRVIRPQKADKLGREAEAEYHYQNGLHEFGPAFGTKYVATMIKLTRDQAAREFLSKATALDQGDNFPQQIEYNGKVYYSPDAALDIHAAGKRRVETYGTYTPSPYPSKEAPQRNLAFAAKRYLGPRAVTDALNGLDAAGPNDPSAIKRFFQEQVVGLGFGIPHMGNILRRVMQSAPMGVANPVGWVRAIKVAFSRELKARGISGVDDPTFDRLAKFGAIASDSEVSSFKKFAGGNLNPANWLRPFSKVGHDILFKPGAIDQRARLYIADLIKSQHPEFSDSRVAQAVNEQLGNYNRANWTKVQQRISRFVLFPGWDMSSMNWVLRHPIRTSLPPALLIWLANQTIHSMGGNRESEKNDLFAIHAGDRVFNTNLIREPLGTVLGGGSLRFGHALLQGKSQTRAVAEASRGVATDVTRPLSMLRPDIGTAIELGTNRERIGGSREIYKSSDFSTPGRVLPNVGIEKIAMHVVTRMLPQLDRVAQATDGGKWDIARFVGGNVGVSNYHVDAESRLRSKIAIASDYEKAKTTVMHQDPKALREMFTKDPDAAVYLAFRPYIQQSLGQLGKIDQATELVSSSAQTPDQKRAAIAALEKVRDQEMAKADKIDRAVEMVLKHVHERPGSVLPTLQGSRPSEAQP